MSTLSQFSSGGIKSIQRGTISIGANQSAATVTIAEVNTAKTILNFCGCANGYYAVSTTTFATLAHIRLASSTQVTATAFAPTSTAIAVSYEVIEYF